MIKILNVVKQINNGGSGWSIVSIAKSLISSGEFDVTIVSLMRTEINQSLTSNSGIKILMDPSAKALNAAIIEADIVQVDWWNDPMIYDFLRMSNIPECRMCAFIHVAGDNWPNLLTAKLIDFVDFVIAGCRYGSTIPILRNLPKEVYAQKVGWVFATTDFTRLANFQHTETAHFTVGYVGSVDFKKMDPNFIKMSAAVNIPNVRFLVIGRGHIDILKKQAEALGVSERFEFTGFVHDIKSYFERMDVFGYPLCDAPGAELVIQDALYAGIPAVVFPLGGLQDAIHDNFNGLVVNDENEYTKAIEYLYNHPDERKIMGENARRFAMRVYGGENSAARLKKIYRRMINTSKKKRKWRADNYYREVLGHATGSAQFIESLGHQAEPFLAAFHPKSENFAAGIMRIYHMTPKEKTIVLRYNVCYPNDPYLKFWQGISELSEANIDKSEQLFQQALALGLPLEVIQETQALPLNK